MIYHLYIGTGKHPAEHVFNGSKEKCIELAQRWVEKMNFTVSMTETISDSVIWDDYAHGKSFALAYAEPELPHNDESRFDYVLKHTPVPKHNR